MEYRLRDAPNRWIGLMNTQSKPIAFARIRCVPHCVNGPASKGNKLYKIMSVAPSFPKNDACRSRRRQEVVSVGFGRFPRRILRLSLEAQFLSLARSGNLLLSRKGKT